MEEGLLKRITPHSLEAEQSVIGSMLMDKDAIAVAAEILTAEDFYQKQYALVFDAIISLFGQDKPVDLVTLQDKLVKDNAPPEMQSLDFIRDILNTVPTSANVKYYAEIVRDKAVLRRLIKNSEGIIQKCYEQSMETEEILEETEKTVFDILKRKGTHDFVPIEEVALAVLQKIQDASKTKGHVTGVPTGFTDLDYMTTGFQPSDFILIAARPSMGKTAFVLNIIEHVALRKTCPA